MKCITRLLTVHNIELETLTKPIRACFDYRSFMKAERSNQTAVQRLCRRKFNKLR